MSKKSEKEVENIPADGEAVTAEEGRASQVRQVGQGGQSAAAEEVPDGRMRLAIGAAADKKALDVVVLDLRAVANFTDCFIIASGANIRQVQAIADAVEETLKRHGTRPARIEGYNAAEWVLIDYGDFIVHVFEGKARQFYDLERLWRDASRVAVPEAAGPGEAAAGVAAANQSEDV